MFFEYTPKSKLLPTLKLLLPLVALPYVAQATDYTWTGAVDGDWDDPGNWSGGTGTDVPDDEGDLAIFNGAGTTEGKSVTLNSTYQINVDFQSAGWTVSGGGQFTLMNAGSGGLATPLKSSGAGTNTLDISILNDRGNDWEIGTGNTLVHTGNIDFDVGATKLGDGTLILNSSSSSPGAGNVSTEGGTTLVNYPQNEAGNFRPTVEFGATLGGSGTIQIGPGSQNLQLRVAREDSGGIVNPGGDGTVEGGSIIGTLSVDFTSTGSSNVVQFTDTATFQVDIDPTLNTTDLLAITRSGSATDGGNLTIDASSTTLDISTIGSVAFDPGDIFTIATFVTASDYGEFESVLLNGSDAFLDPNFFVNYNATSIEVGLVPEPSFYAVLGGVAMLGLAYVRRRR